ncbi:MAG: LysR substrate-binding domain-containing protein [Acidovorax sp.]|uniref:LysR substrate-binding domain-containing protein n=1 Tax=Acidovorax sp. TaxID=1872122 RepID=UPI00391DDF94
MLNPLPRGAREPDSALPTTHSPKLSLLKNSSTAPQLPHPQRGERRSNGQPQPPHCASTFAISPRLSTDSLYALRSAARARLGACISSAWIVDEELRAGDMLNLVPTWQAPPLPVYLVYPYARFYPARLRLFLEAMRGGYAGVGGNAGGWGNKVGIVSGRRLSARSSLWRQIKADAQRLKSADQPAQLAQIRCIERLWRVLSTARAIKFL